MLYSWERILHRTNVTHLTGEEMPDFYKMWRKLTVVFSFFKVANIISFSLVFLQIQIKTRSRLSYLVSCCFYIYSFNHTISRMKSFLFCSYEDIFLISTLMNYLLIKRIIWKLVTLKNICDFLPTLPRLLKSIITWY